MLGSLVHNNHQRNYPPLLLSLRSYSPNIDANMMHLMIRKNLDNIGNNKQQRRYSGYIMTFCCPNSCSSATSISSPARCLKDYGYSLFYNRLKMSRKRMCLMYLISDISLGLCTFIFLPSSVTLRLLVLVLPNGLTQCKASIMYEVVILGIFSKSYCEHYDHHI